MVLLLGIFSLLSGCGKKKFDEIVPVPFPDNAHLTYFCINHQGMMMEPYYILKAADSGNYLKIISAFPDEWEESEVKEISAEDELIQELKNAISENGALDWDGYDEKVSGKGASDSGDHYELQIELSDGTSVKMRGYNTCPAGFESLLGQVRELFDE